MAGKKKTRMELANIMMFDTMRWRTDDDLAKCSPAARCFLFELMCVAHLQKSKGKVSGTERELTVLTRSQGANIIAMMDELSNAGVTVVTCDSGTYTLSSEWLGGDAANREILRLRSWISYRWHELVDALSMRDGRMCRHCQGTGRLTIDHKKPLSKGGSNELRNLQLLCGSCNSRKGARYVER